MNKDIVIGLMHPQDGVFDRTESGFLSFEYQGVTYSRVGLRRVMPHALPFEYISVIDSEQKEICIIKDLAELDEKQQELVKQELSVRYYTPRIVKINHVKDNMGYVYIDALLGDQQKNFAVKDVSKNIKLISGQMLLIFDVDGNRYIIDDIQMIDKKSLRMLEPYLF